MTSNDHKIYMVVDNSYINVYQTSNFKHLDTIQIYGTLQHITLTEREDNLLSIYHCNNRTLAVVKIFGHSKMNRHQFEDYSYQQPLKTLKLTKYDHFALLFKDSFDII